MRARSSGYQLCLWLRLPHREILRTAYDHTSLSHTTFPAVIFTENLLRWSIDGEHWSNGMWRMLYLEIRTRKTLASTQPGDIPTKNGSCINLRGSLLPLVFKCICKRAAQVALCGEGLWNIYINIHFFVLFFCTNPTYNNCSKLSGTKWAQWLHFKKLGNIFISGMWVECGSKGWD